VTVSVTLLADIYGAENISSAESARVTVVPPPPGWKSYYIYTAYPLIG
jgi:hypothetical protein